MADVALLMWVVTAAGGLLLLLLWYRHGGAGKAPDDPPGAEAADDLGRGVTNLHHSLVMAHVSVALAGLTVWFIFARNVGRPDYSPAPWVALAALLLAATLGLTMYRRWRTDRRALAAGRLDPVPAEQHIPAPVVWLHGLAAAATIVLVFLVAVTT